MNPFSSEILRIIVGHCSLNIGWDGIQASSLDLLTEVLQKYLLEIGQSTHRYSEQFGRTEPNLDDLGLTFRELGVSIQDLSDYVSNVEPIPLPQDIPKLPISREHHLNFLKPGSHEILCRPVHIHEHLPPMHELLPDQQNGGETQEIEDNSIVPSFDTEDAASTDSTLSPKTNLFKRPDGTEKRVKGLLRDEEGQPLREISSVMMTTSGYLSSSREGKLPELKLQKSFLDPEPELASSERKVSMKKIIEGIKKSDEISRRIEREVEAKRLEKVIENEIQAMKAIDDMKEKEEVMLKEKEQDREAEIDGKIKFKDRERKPKKRTKETVMEEFDFFGKTKEKTSTKTVVSDAKPIVDSSKQKLNVFRKINKSKEVDASLPSTSSLMRTTVESECSSTFSSTSDGGSGNISVETATKCTSIATNMKAINHQKEKKSKHRKEVQELGEKINFPGMDKTAGEVGAEELKDVLLQKEVRSKQESSDAEPSKTKRGRRSRMLSPEFVETSTESRATTPSAQAGPSAPKPFFPFPTHLPVPGLIPPPFFQNVPFNLLGMTPVGLRPPSSSSHLSNSSVAPLQNASPQSPFLAAHKNDSSTNASSPSPTPSKSPLNIVDSLSKTTENISESSIIEMANSSKKKDKRDRKDKEKKKKEKRDKEKGIDKDKKAKREKKKDRKEKIKEKDDASPSVPKITFKFGATPLSPRLSEQTPKLIFKTMNEKEVNKSPSLENQEETPPSPTALPVDIAKFSALVTRPPKVTKNIKKEIAPEKSATLSPTRSPDLSQAEAGSCRSPSPNVRREKPQKPPRVTKEKDKERKKVDKTGDVAVITETIGSYYDEFGNKIWICPACGRQDDGTPMIGCDECDDWYHWVCVGIRVPPAETESWFCQRCIARKQGSLKDKKKGRKKKSV